MITKEEKSIVSWVVITVALSYLTFYLNSVDHWTTWPTGFLCVFSAMCVLSAGSISNKSDAKGKDSEG